MLKLKISSRPWEVHFKRKHSEGKYLRFGPLVDVIGNIEKVQVYKSFMITWMYQELLCN